MARPKSKILSASLFKDRGAYRLMWGRGGNRVSLSLSGLLEGLSPEAADRRAEVLRLELTTARAKDAWPPWALPFPSVQRLIAGASTVKSVAVLAEGTAHATPVPQVGLYDAWASSHAEHH